MSSCSVCASCSLARLFQSHPTSASRATFHSFLEAALALASTLQQLLIERFLLGQSTARSSPALMQACAPTPSELHYTRILSQGATQA